MRNDETAPSPHPPFTGPLPMLRNPREMVHGFFGKRPNGGDHLGWSRAILCEKACLSVIMQPREYQETAW